MSEEIYTHQTPPDERGNVIHIESPQPIVRRIIRESIAWYWGQPHHRDMSEPEHRRQIWISTVEIGHDSARCWKYFSKNVQNENA